jgi:ribosomal protein L39E
MATSPRDNPAGPYLRYPCSKAQDEGTGLPLWVLVKSQIVYRERVVQNYRRRGHRRAQGNV